jgi:hypothetical protein
VIKRVLILGSGTVFLAVLAIGFYFGSVAAFRIYVGTHRHDIQAELAERSQRHHEEVEKQRAVLKTASSAPTIHFPPTASASNPLPDPSESSYVLVDSQKYGTEDNWLASFIAREIAGESFAAGHPDDTLSTFQTHAEVNPEDHTVHVEITGGANGDVEADLKPSFVWDGGGYVPLAQRCLSGGSPRGTDAPDDADILSDLQDLTANRLVEADQRLSGELAKTPASWRQHEAAALALCALALRENAGIYSEKRHFLCRAAAHLAVAGALRGNAAESWPGLVADSAIRALSGREMDALNRLAELARRSDCPTSAGPWLTALMLEATQNWTMAKVTPASPLIERIIWFQVHANNVDSMLASKALDQVLALPSQNDPNPANPDLQLPDWCRAILAGPPYISVENGHRFTETNLALELKELTQIRRVEGAPFDPQHPSAALAEPEEATVSVGADGKAQFAVIGRGTFAQASRRHLFFTTQVTYDWLKSTYGVPEEAAQFRAAVIALFQGATQAELMDERLNDVLSRIRNGDDLADEWISEGKRWNIEDVPYGIASEYSSHSDAAAFYAGIVPFGTAFEAANRKDLIDKVGIEAKNQAFQALAAQVRNLPAGQQLSAIRKLMAPVNARYRAEDSNGPKPIEKQLLDLNPDNYVLATDHLAPAELITASQRFLDYDLRAFWPLEKLSAKDLDSASREALLRRHAAIDPDEDFQLAYLLRSEGRVDEAAEIDRAGFAKANDQVLMSASMRPLVAYDMEHGKKDEAEKIAAAAAEVYSQSGLLTQMALFEKEGRLDEAEQRGKDVQQRYGTDRQLIFFYARHPDHFPDAYAAQQRKLFPDGMSKSSIDSFTASPDDGVSIEADLPSSTGLQKGDVIVALGGYRVQNTEQFYFVGATVAKEAQLDCVLWRDGKYVEVQEPMSTKMSILSSTITNLRPASSAPCPRF